MKKGVTIVELLITISILAAGIFPLLTALSNLTESALIQKDILSALTIGKRQMDLWLTQFQTIDNLLPSGATDYTNMEIISPPLPVPGVSLTSDEGKRYRDIYYNNTHFRILANFTYMDGTNGTPALSTLSKAVYRIDLTVWRIQSPLMNDEQTMIVNPAFGKPGFARGDEPLYKLSSFYSQANQFTALSE
jgi:hypothetical protein